MTVHCPHCATGYVLPDHLMGPRGARVRCPRCQKSFVVPAGGPATAAPEGEPEASRTVSSPAESPPATTSPVMDTAPVTEPLPTPVPRIVAAGPASSPSQERPAAADDPQAIARQVLGELAQRLGRSFDEACTAGAMLSRFGPEVMGAFEEYRRRAGAAGGSMPFRRALRERYGVDLLAGGPEPS